MYYLKGLKARFATDDSGIVPNERFLAIYDKIQAGAKVISR